MLLSGAIANVSAVQVIVLTAVPVAVFFLVLHVWQQKSGKGKLPLPPTPPGKPILGNLPDFVSAAKQGTAHLLVEDWTRQYGDIIRVKLGPFTEYFLSSDVAVKQLIDKASAQTAGRPRWIVSNEQMCNKLNVLFLDGSDPRWKFQRKVIHSALTSIPRADAGIPFLHYETAKFLDEVLHDPDAGTASQELWAPIQRYTYSTFAAQTFGMEVPDSDDPVIHFVHETGLASILATLPGAHLVEILPFLEKLPMFMKPWEQSARARFRRDFQWTTERLHRAKKDIENGISHEAFLHQVLKDDKLLGFANEEEAAYLTLQLMLGAADTSQISTWSFLEAMMLFPEVQAKARQEIEAHVGDRMPVYEDLEQIPYVRCLMKEVWRWRPPVALGHPHTTTQELTYNGYRIPKGSVLHINAWAIGHSATRHPNPEQFIPERWTGDLTTTQQSLNSSDPKKRDHFAFGSGRRVCPGYHIAERSLAIAIMRILWAFDIKPAPGTEELLRDPKHYHGQMPGNPGPEMPVTLTVRSEEKKKIIETNWEREKERHVPMGTLR